MSMVGSFRLVEDAELERLRAEPNAVIPFLDEQSAAAAEDEVYLDKAWHGIHYLLTGTDWKGDWPLNFVVGGEPVGDVDVGYGPPTGFTSTEVKQIAEALAPLDDDELTRRYDPAAMKKADIYPDIWDREKEREENLTYLLVNFRQLKALVDRGAREGRAMLGWIS